MELSKGETGHDYFLLSFFKAWIILIAEGKTMEFFAKAS